MISDRLIGIHALGFITFISFFCVGFDVLIYRKTPGLRSVTVDTLSVLCRCYWVATPLTRYLRCREVRDFVRNRCITRFHRNVRCRAVTMAIEQNKVVV